MNKFISKSMNLGLKLIFIPIICYSILYLFIVIKGGRLQEEFKSLIGDKEMIIGQLIVIILGIIALYYIFKYIASKDINKEMFKKILLIIIACGFILRLIWIINIKTVPTSDFEYIWETSINIYNGDVSSMHGIEYLARFPHLIITTLYFGAFRFLFNDNALITVKIINVILSMISVLGITLICKELFSRKVALFAAVIATIFPPFIMYTSVTCSENMAMPFFIFSIYIFIYTVKNELALRYIFMAGVLLSFGNMFRSVGIVILVAYIVYILVYSKEIILNIKRIGTIVIAFFIPLIIISTILVKFNISEYKLYAGRESNITSVLKGTNLSNFGGWNEADAQIPFTYNHDKEKVKKASLDIIKERLTSQSPPKLAVFYTGKFTTIWGSGDYSAQRWATDELNGNKMSGIYSYMIVGFNSVLYIAMLLIMYYSLLGHNVEKNKNIDLINIIFGGFWILYLITERQTRYGFIVSFVFIIFAMAGIDKFINKKMNLL